MIDAHIHLDHYKDDEISQLMETIPQIENLISVSYDLESCKRNHGFTGKYQKVRAAFGYHPEQPLPTVEQQNELFSWMNDHIDVMIAIGEVGLPYYLRKKQKVTTCQYEQYRKLLEAFVQKASTYGKPIVLHAVHEDAPIVCDLLEKYSVKNAHFHWFKGDNKTITRMKENGYYISVTPDVVYDEEIQQLVQRYPLEQMMIETDGPWPFEGPFLGTMTHPNMMLESIKEISKIKKLSEDEVSERLWKNTRLFYQL
ncbi:TatD family hydrolase [Neobacillus sp. B4I6]|uniref:TatD family hydrolase n=1 Tax=Neobacillus sp. B4I6 TaxID=3373925 RepID=UPI003D208AF5